jgi:hypothetical protein
MYEAGNEHFLFHHELFFRTIPNAPSRPDGA